jgi:hypothetical protein
VRITTRKFQQHHATGDSRETQQSNDTSLGLVPSRKPRTSEGGNQLDRSKGHVEEHSVELVEAEGFDDERAECGDAAAGDSARC